MCEHNKRIMIKYKYGSVASSEHDFNVMWDVSIASRITFRFLFPLFCVCVFSFYFECFCFNCKTFLNSDFGTEPTLITVSIPLCNWFDSHYFYEVFVYSFSVAKFECIWWVRMWVFCLFLLWKIWLPSFSDWMLLLCCVYIQILKQQLFFSNCVRSMCTYDEFVLFCS